VPGTDRFVPDNRFNDIGVIQYNEDTHKTCYFYTLSTEGIQAGRDLTQSGPRQEESLIPPPYSASHASDEPAAHAARNFWYPPSLIRDTNCTKCHNAGPWIQDPYVMQANDDYRANHRVHGQRVDNRVPSNPRGVLTQQVGDMFASWNSTERPFRIRINEPAFLAALQPAERTEYTNALDNGSVANLNECTSCHDLGTNRDPRFRDEGTCGFVRAFATGQNPGTVAYQQRAVRLSDWARTFPHSAWMPPDHGMETEASYEQYYRFALGAIDACCQHPEMTGQVDGRSVPLCYDPALEDPTPASSPHSPHATGGVSDHRG
jgi:hypothetical protein